MRRTIIYMTIGVMVLSLSSCFKKAEKAYGKEVTKTIRVDSFHDINIGVPAAVYYVQDSVTSIRIVGFEKLIDKDAVTVEDSVLDIHEKEDGSKLKIQMAPRPRLKIFISSPTIRNVAISGSGSFKSRHAVHAGLLSLKVYGSGSYSLPSVQAKSVNMNISGSGDISVGAVCADSVSAAIYGSGDMSFNSNNVRITHLVISGSGDMKVGFRKGGLVTTSISGSGDIRLSGDIQKLDKLISGSGDIDMDGLTIKNK